MKNKRMRGYILDPQGKRRWYSYYSKEDKDRALFELVEKMQEYSGLEPITFRKWVKRWQDTYRSNESMTMRSDTNGRLNNYVYPIIGSMYMQDIKPIHIQRIFVDTVNLSQSSNHKLYVSLNQIFNSAIDNDIINRSPMRGIKKPSPRGSTRRALTDEERKALLEVLNGDSASTMCMLSLYAGLRPSESAALMWEDVDFKKSLISVNKALKRDGYIGEPKSKAGNRSIPMPDILKNYLKAQMSTGYVLTNKNGEPLKKRAIYDRWIDIKNRMHAPDDISLYSLRHTYCTDLERAGVPLNVAKILMGHEDVNITAKIYTHTTLDTIDNARKTINNSHKKM